VGSNLPFGFHQEQRLSGYPAQECVTAAPEGGIVRGSSSTTGICDEEVWPGLAIVTAPKYRPEVTFAVLAVMLRVPGAPSAKTAVSQLPPFDVCEMACRDATAGWTRTVRDWAVPGAEERRNDRPAGSVVNATGGARMVGKSPSSETAMVAALLGPWTNTEAE
jgi:hypothetical protein